MIGVFLKELRENLKWAQVIFIVTILFVYYEMRRSDPEFLFRLPNGIPFMGPMAGLLMGVVQSFFETKPDNWAFVVHRPVPRVQIYLAKCGAGLLLLYAAVGLPFLLATVWAARPGNIAMPFQWRAVLPMVVETFNAGSFYFVGVVITLRKARWFGTRLLPIGLVLVCTAFIDVYINTFGEAMTVVALMHILGAAAAWGVFATAGECDRPGAWRVGLGALIAGGALPLCVILSSTVQMFYGGSTMRWQQYQIDRDGNLLHIVWSREPSGERSSIITDPADKPIEKYEGMDIDDPANTDQLVRLGSALFDDHLNKGFGRMLTGNDYRNGLLGVMRLRTVAPPNVRVRSLCLFDRQKKIIDLYDPVTRVLEGTVGPAGFANARTPNAPFPGEPLNPYQQGGMRTLAFSSGVYWMELHQRRVRQIFTAAADDPVISALELPPQNDPTIVIATQKQLHVLRPTGEAIFSMPLPGDPRKDYFQPAILPENHHLELYVGSMPWLAKTPDFRNEYVEFTLDGQLVRRTPMPNAPDLGGAKEPETALFGAVYPMVLSLIIPDWIIDNVFDLRLEQYSMLFHRTLHASAAIYAIATLLLGLRMGFGRLHVTGWAIVNILLGPCGMIAMLGLNEWPARETCPACHSKRFLARRECSRCAVASPPPKTDGREIFEPCDSLQPSM